MKYLNEAKHISELQEICREHLIDLDRLEEAAQEIFIELLDKDFTISVIIDERQRLNYFSLKKKNDTFIWKQVKDTVLTFIDMYEDEFSLKSFEVKHDGGPGRDVSLSLERAQLYDFWMEIKEIRIGFYYEN